MQGLRLMVKASRDEINRKKECFDPWREDPQGLCRQAGWPDEDSYA